MAARIAALACTSLLIFHTGAHAEARVWTLTGVTFADGGTASGTFVFDSDANPPFGAPGPDFHISVSGGDTGSFPAFIFDPSNADLTIFNGVFGLGTAFVVQTKEEVVTPFGRPRELRFVTVAELRAPGTVDIDTQETALEATECYTCSPFRRVVAGSVVSSQASFTYLAAGDSI